MKFINIKTDSEIKILADLACEIWHEYWPTLLSNEQINYMVNKFQSFDSIKNQIQYNSYTYNIIQDNENIIGYYGISEEKNFIFLSKLYIKKEYRNQGYGKKIFENIKQTAKSLNKKYIKLTVNKYNTNTIEAYLKWGLKKTDKAVTDIGNGFVMDDYIMEYYL